MEFWTLSGPISAILLEFVLLAALLVVGIVACRSIGVLKRYLIPASLIAGFLGLVLGPEISHVVSFSAERMGSYVYHLLALTFIGVGLQSTNKHLKYGAINLGFMQVAVMVMQAIIGLGIALASALLLFPELNPSTGMLLPLGFAMGPGIAYSIGSSWATFGFQDAASIGLSISAIGFLFAYVTGVLIATRYIKRSGKDRGASTSSSPKLAELTPTVPESEVCRDSTPRSARQVIGQVLVHIVLVGLVYSLTFLLVLGLEWALVRNNLSQEVPIVWSFHFIFANLLALLVKRIIVWIGRADFIDIQIMRKMTATLADFLVAASIAAISLRITWTYAGPVLIMCVLGAWLTFILLKWTSGKVFLSHRFERFIGMYAQMTGTISSGLALIRITDPDYRTPVAEDLVLSSGLALAFGFPLLVLINMPFTVFAESTEGYLIILAVLLAYLVLICSAWYLFIKRSTRSQDGQN